MRGRRLSARHVCILFSLRPLNTAHSEQYPQYKTFTHDGTVYDVAYQYDFKYVPHGRCLVR